MSTFLARYYDILTKKDTPVQGSSGSMSITDAAYLTGSTRTDLAISAVSAQTATLTGGLYDAWSSTDCFILVEADASTVTISNGYLLRANNTITLSVPASAKVGAITSAAAGTLSLFKVQ